MTSRTYVILRPSADNDGSEPEAITSAPVPSGFISVMPDPPSNAIFPLRPGNVACAGAAASATRSGMANPARHHQRLRMSATLPLTNGVAHMSSLALLLKEW